MHNMKNIIANKRLNNVKTIMLMSVMFLIILFFSWLLAISTHNISFIWGGVIISVAINIASYYFSDTIALYTSGATEANPDEYSEYFDIVRSLTSKAQMPMPHLYIIADPSPNAFATGRDDAHAAVAVTTGLLAMMTTDELTGVIAHELSHIRNRDILIMSAVVIMAGIFSMIANLFINLSLSGSNFNNQEKGDYKGSIFMLAISIVASLLLPLASMIVQASISRKREFVADAAGVLLAEDSIGLTSALQKLDSFNMPLARASSATAHLYISSPFGKSNFQSFWQRLFMTHPPIEERVKALQP